MKISGRILYLFLLAVLITACGGNAGAEATVDVNSIFTAGVGTLVASFFETQTALYTPPVNTSTPVPLPSGTSAPTNVATLVSSPTFQIIYASPTLGTGTPSLTPTVTGTVFTATVDPGSLASGCNNMALVFQAIDPNNTTYKAGEWFRVTWKVANTGSCNWIHSYRLVFVSGDQMGGDSMQRLARTITPGDWTEWSLDLQAPNVKGTYTGSWRMTDPDGKAFGVTLAVSIKVGPPPTETPEPTALPTGTSTPTPTSTATATPTSTP
jgi:hypothetical protein